MDPNQENAMTILKAMVEGSRRRGNGDVIKMLTNLSFEEINNAVPCLEDMGLVQTLRGRKKIRYEFFNVTLAPAGYQYYNDNFGKIKAIE
ncbi:MAG: hypothetical protein HY802_03950 [Methanobacterium sp.]|nr:hypothetical protein [Methanobacterium sp.]